MSENTKKDIPEILKKLNERYGVPIDFLYLRTSKEGNETPCIKLGGLMYLADQMGMYKIQTKDITDYITNTVSCTYSTDNNGNPIVPVTNTEVKKEPRDGKYYYEASIYLIPSDEYLEKKGITKDDKRYELLCMPTVAHGEADESNCGAVVKKYLEMMAETRAVVRALRFMTGCPITASEEMNSRDFEMCSINELCDMNKDTNSAPTVEDAKANRKTLITTLKELRNKHEYGDQIVSDYLDSKNKGLIENLDDASLKELIGKLR